MSEKWQLQQHMSKSFQGFNHTHLISLYMNHNATFYFYFTAE